MYCTARKRIYLARAMSDEEHCCPRVIDNGPTKLLIFLVVSFLHSGDDTDGAVPIMSAYDSKRCFLNDTAAESCVVVRLLASLINSTFQAPERHSCLYWVGVDRCCFLNDAFLSLVAQFELCVLRPVSHLHRQTS